MLFRLKPKKFLNKGLYLRLRVRLPHEHVTPINFLCGKGQLIAGSGQAIYRFVMGYCVTDFGSQIRCILTALSTYNSPD